MEKVGKNNFIFTAVSAAFGLGSVFRFPALCLKYGGAFLIAYAAVCAIIALPVMYAELRLGKRGSAFPLKSICPAGALVDGAAVLNSGVMCACYGVVVSSLAIRACAFYPSVNYDCPAHMPELIPVVLLLAFIALAFILTRKQASVARISRFVVLFQAAMLALLALRGLLYSNAWRTLKSTLFAFGNLSDGGLWLDALGQMLLSLSLAAGVMPAIARGSGGKLNPLPCAAATVGANFTGGLISAVATITLAGGSGALSGDFQGAMELFPAALSSAFSNAYACGVFGALFFCSLACTALMSMVALARPALALAAFPKKTPRAAAFALCAGLCMLSLALCLTGTWREAEALSCNAAAPFISFGELLCFAFRLLTKRRGGVKIVTWKILKS